MSGRNKVDAALREAQRSPAPAHAITVREASLRAEIDRLMPYVGAFRREQARADRLGVEVNDLNRLLTRARAELAKAIGGAA